MTLFPAVAPRRLQPASACEVQEISDFRLLAASRAEWSQLLADTAEASFFHTLDWFEVYWRHYGQQQRLRVLLVFRQQRLIGIVPLVVRNEPTRAGRVRVLTYPLHDWGSFYSPLGAEPQATLAAGLAHLRRTRRDWDLLDLRWIDPAADAGLTPAAMREAGFQPCTQPWTCSAWIDLECGWQQYWASRCSHWRNNVRRAQRKVAALGAVEHVRYRPAGVAAGQSDPRWDLYDACLRIAGQSWQASASDGTTLSHAKVRDFLREAHAAAAAAGCLDLNLLYVAGRPAAFAYNYCYQGRIYGLRTGYDASVCREGAGSALFFAMIEDSFRRGDRLIDLGAGYFESKRYWHNKLRESYRYTHFPLLAPRSQLLRLKRWWQSRRPSTG